MLRKQPKFQMQINSNIVLTNLLHVENMQYRPLRTAPLVRRFNRYFYYTTLRRAA